MQIVTHQQRVTPERPERGTRNPDFYSWLCLQVLDKHEIVLAAPGAVCPFLQDSAASGIADSAPTFPLPTPGTTILLSASVNLTALGSSCKWTCAGISLR